MSVRSPLWRRTSGTRRSTSCAAGVVLAADDAVDVVPLGEQQLGEVEAVLAGDAGDRARWAWRDHASAAVPRRGSVGCRAMKILVSGGAGYIGSHTVDPARRGRPRRGDRRQLQQLAADRAGAPRGADRHQPADALLRPARLRQDRAPLRRRGLRRRHPLRRLQGGRRERREAARLLREQPRLHVLPGPGHAALRRRQARLLLQRDRLRHRPGRRHRGPAHVRHQPLRLDQGDAGADPHRRGPGRRRRCASRCCATSTRSARTPPARSARTRPRSPTT